MVGQDETGGCEGHSLRYQGGDGTGSDGLSTNTYIVSNGDYGYLRL